MGSENIEFFVNSEVSLRFRLESNWTQPVLLIQRRSDSSQGDRDEIGVNLDEYISCIVLSPLLPTSCPLGKVNGDHLAVTVAVFIPGLLFPHPRRDFVLEVEVDSPASDVGKAESLPQLKEVQDI